MDFKKQLAQDGADKKFEDRLAAKNAREDARLLDQFRKKQQRLDDKTLLATQNLWNAFQTNTLLLCENRAAMTAPQRKEPVAQAPPSEELNNFCTKYPDFDEKLRLMYNRDRNALGRSTLWGFVEKATGIRKEQLADTVSHTAFTAIRDHITALLERMTAEALTP